MHVRQHFVIVNEDSQIPLNYEIDFTKSDMLKLQVIGDGTCEIKVYGKISKDLDYLEVSILKDSDYSFINTITEKGLYTVSATGYQMIKVSVISAESVSCYANEVSEV